MRYRNREIGHGAAGPARRRVLRPDGPGAPARRGRAPGPARRAGRPAADLRRRRPPPVLRRLAGRALRADRRDGPAARIAGAARVGGRPPAAPGAALPRRAGRPAEAAAGLVAAPAGALRPRDGRGLLPQRPPRQAADRVPLLHPGRVGRAHRPRRRAARAAGAGPGHGRWTTRRSSDGRRGRRPRSRRCRRAGGRRSRGGWASSSC